MTSLSENEMLTTKGFMESLSSDEPLHDEATNLEFSVTLLKELFEKG